MYIQRAESALDRFLPPAHEEPVRLHEAMRYACLNGGKRIRAMLTYAAGTALGGDLSDLDIPASAVEMIHAYSLIHDDLPAMDDDELRRGRPTCHIAYGEATAILAGDALQTRAFEILADADSPVSDECRSRMVAVLAQAVGSTGMVGGQVLDMAGEKRSLGLEDLRKIHDSKTGALIAAAVVMGGLGSRHADPSILAAYEQFGREIGTAFQIVDDVLDETGDTETLGKPTGSDRQAGKSTYPAAIGLEKSRHSIREHYRMALKILESVPGDARLLRDIAHLVVDRSF
ncbi:MAG: Farnesyl diphosphate synthase [Gammaproteobacteria bacterium]|nr:Farnesyl diphosphate synthase [Gammaproteobacteria bacterium]